MAEHHPSTTEMSGSPKDGIADKIELGATVHDAVGVAIGTVHDVDADRRRLVVDGRPMGLGQFEVPLTAVESVVGNEVHLNLQLDTVASRGDTVKFVRPPAEARTTGSTQQATPAASYVPPASSRSTSTGTNRAPVWVHEEQESSNGTLYGLAGLAVAGLAAGVGYYWWRQMQRKSALDRAIDFVTEHPTWFAAAAAALPALPALFYARSSDAFSMADARQQLGRTAPARWMGMEPSRTSDFFDSASEYMPEFPNRPSGTSLGVAAGIALAAAAAIYAATRARQYPSYGEPPMRISDVMTHRPQAIRPDASIADAASLMRRLDVGALPVVDSGRLLGMLTDRDIAVRVAADGRDPHLTLVRDVMSTDTTSANQDDPVEAAARIMREHRIRRLPIVDERHNLVGIVSLGDLATDVGDDRLSGQTLEEVSEPSRPRR